jgi:transcriptional regulator
MYVPSSFAETDAAWITGFIDEVRLAQLVCLGDQGLVATPVPLLHRPSADGWGSLVGHVARANHDAPAGPALALFTGAHGYVSPGWYPSKAEHGRAVPTWNYETLHVRGTLVRHDEPAWIFDVVRQLTDVHEAGLATPWSVDDAPEGFVDGLLRAIVGIELHIEVVEAKRKLSQNRSAADIDGVRRGLATEQRPTTPSLADALERAVAPA